MPIDELGNVPIQAIQKPDILNDFLNSPYFWLVLIFIGIIVLLIWLVSKYKKSDKSGKEIFDDIVQTEVKSIMKVFGISSNSKLYHGLNCIAVAKKYCLTKTNLEHHKKTDSKLTDLSEKVDIEKSIRSKDFNFYLMKCCKTGLFNSILSALGIGNFYMLIQKELVFLREKKIYLDGNINFDEFGKVWVLAQHDTIKIVLNLYWKNNYENVLGEIAEVPRKLAYLETLLPREVEKTEKTIEAIETGKRSKMKKFF